MKLLSAVFAVITVLSAAEPRVAPRPGVAPRPTVAPRLVVPKGAVQSAPGTFRYTDAKGVKWIYRETPFGVARLKDVPENATVPAPDPGAGIKATIDGDTVRFERPGPFGVYKWEKSKSDLNDAERAALNRTLNQSMAAAPAK